MLYGGGPEEPDVEILAVSDATGYATSLDGLAPVTEHHFDIQAICQRHRDGLLVGQQRWVGPTVDLDVLVGRRRVLGHEHDVGVAVIVDVRDVHTEVIRV